MFNMFSLGVMESLIVPKQRSPMGARMKRGVMSHQEILTSMILIYLILISIDAHS